MKKKKAKARKQKTRKKLEEMSCGSAEGYPKQLAREDYFKCPIWFADQPKFVNSLNKASDPYIEASKKI